MEVLVTRCYVDVDVEDNEGWTPLHIAGFHGQKDAAAFLISWGALPTVKNKRVSLCYMLRFEDFILNIRKIRI